MSWSSTFGIYLILIICFIGVYGFTLWETNPAEMIQLMKSGDYNPQREFNEFINNLFYKFVPIFSIVDSYFSYFGADAKYYLRTYVRDYVMGTLVYWGTASIWHFIIYHVYADELFVKKGRSFPTRETIIDQMKLAQSSLFIYAALPILSEFLIENKLTKCYYYIDEIGGWTNYSIFLVLYIVCVEVGIYWMHRTLHENKFLYKYVHALHHKYNKAFTLTPWASIAFNPLDGVLQASPYVIFLFFVPVHYFTHIFLLFFSGVWATHIHDSLSGDTEPIMGSKYHTVHHTHYHYNYGQWFIFCDYIFGTLRAPTVTGKGLANKE